MSVGSWVVLGLEQEVDVATVSELSRLYLSLVGIVFLRNYYYYVVLRPSFLPGMLWFPIPSPAIRRRRQPVDYRWLLCFCLFVYRFVYVVHTVPPADNPILYRCGAQLKFQKKVCCDSCNGFPLYLGGR